MLHFFLYLYQINRLEASQRLKSPIYKKKKKKKKKTLATIGIGSGILYDLQFTSLMRKVRGHCQMLPVNCCNTFGQSK